MADSDRKGKQDAEVARGREGSTHGEPFRESGSGGSYSADSNWAAERNRDDAGGAGGPSMAGAPSGAGDGGFGPEGDFAGRDGQGAADVLGQVNGDNSQLIEEAHERGPRRADRRFTGGEGIDEPDGRD